MIWTLASMLKSHVLYFFSNYVQHINDINDTRFPWFERQRIQKNISWTSSMEYHLRIEAQKKLWFGPLQLCLSDHVLHFFQIISNTLMIFVTHFFHGLNVRIKKIYISWTSSMEYHLRIEAQNKIKKTMIWTLFPW